MRYPNTQIWQATAGKDVTRPALQCVHIGEGMIAAADGYMLAALPVELEPGDTPRNIPFEVFKVNAPKPKQATATMSVRETYVQTDDDRRWDVLNIHPEPEDDRSAGGYRAYRPTKYTPPEPLTGEPPATVDNGQFPNWQQIVPAPDDTKLELRLNGLTLWDLIKDMRDKEGRKPSTLLTTFAHLGGECWELTVAALGGSEYGPLPTPTRRLLCNGELVVAPDSLPPFPQAVPRFALNATLIHRMALAISRDGVLILDVPHTGKEPVRMTAPSVPGSIGVIMPLHMGYYR